MTNIIGLAAGKAVSGAKARRNRKRFEPMKPKFINFPVTYMCNMQCRMCNIWKRYEKNPGKRNEELTLEQIQDFFMKNKEYLSEVISVGLTGGEPFMRDDIVEIVKAIHEALPKSAIGIQTNGYMTDRIISQVKKILTFYKDLTLSVSLDGLEKTHDEVRGIKGTYKRALATIKGAKRLKLRQITTGMTLTKKNYKQIMDVYSMAQKMGLEFSCFVADTGDYFDNLDSDYVLNEDELKSVIADLKHFGHKYYMDELRKQLEGKKRTLPCYSGYTSIVIDPYGNVLPCIIRSEIFGNIKQRSLKEILTSKKAERIRRKLDKCVCWNQCEVSTSALVDFYDPLRWFITSSGKRKFLEEMNAKKRKLL